MYVSFSLIIRRIHWSSLWCVLPWALLLWLLPWPSSSLSGRWFQGRGKICQSELPTLTFPVASFKGQMALPEFNIYLQQIIHKKQHNSTDTWHCQTLPLYRPHAYLFSALRLQDDDHFIHPEPGSQSSSNRGSYQADSDDVCLNTHHKYLISDWEEP